MSPVSFANSFLFFLFFFFFTLYYNDFRYLFRISSLRRSEYPFIALSVDWGLGMITLFTVFVVSFCTYRSLLRCGTCGEALSVV